MDPLPERYIFDTNILINYWRKCNPSAILWVQRVLKDEIPAGISVVTEMELWAGVLNAKQERDHKILLAKFRRYQFHTTIARRAGALIRDLKAAKVPFEFPDLMIGATAEFYQADLVTTNFKDFEHLPLKINIIKCD